MQARCGHDCLDAFFHGALELEAWGSETIFREQLVPGLASLVRDGLADEEPPALGQILPAPI